MPCVDEPQVEECRVVPELDEEQELEHGPELVDDREEVSLVVVPLVVESRVVLVPDCWPSLDFELAEQWLLGEQERLALLVVDDAGPACHMVLACRL